VRDDHADVGRAELRVVQRIADRARETVAVVADREESGGFAGIVPTSTSPMISRCAP
jgi:hypothetical protein